MLQTPRRVTADPNMVGPYTYEEVSFLPIALSEVGVPSDEFLSFPIYARTDLRIFNKYAE